MNISLYHAASALNANDRWQELIAENLASSSLPGFKKQEISFEAVQAGLMPASTPSSASAAARAFSLPRASTSTDFSNGDMKYTGQSTDIAVDGAAFFAIQLPNGATAYTRDGEFHISSQGQWVTKQGFPVLGDGGPIQVDLENAAPISVSPDGEVSQGADQKGVLRLVEFDTPKALSPVSGGVFLANDPAAGLRQATTSTVRQGWLEGANTSVVSEMANLITSMRIFEANQRVIQLQDDRMSKAINELAPTN